MRLNLLQRSVDRWVVEAVTKSQSIAVQCTSYNQNPENILLRNWKSKNFSAIFVDQKGLLWTICLFFNCFGQLLTFEREREHLYSRVGSYEVGRWRGDAKKVKKTQWQSKMLCILKAPSYGILLQLLLLRLSSLSQLFFWFLVTHS